VVDNIECVSAPQFRVLSALAQRHRPRIGEQGFKFGLPRQNDAHNKTGLRRNEQCRTLKERSPLSPAAPAESAMA